MGPFGSCLPLVPAHTLFDRKGAVWVDDEATLTGKAIRPWAIQGTEVAASLATDTSRGLTSAEAAARLAIHGPNELAARGVKPVWVLFAEQFASAMIVVLLAAAVITALLGDLKDTFVILAIVVLNGIVGFVQEYRAEQALAALRRLTSPTARVSGTVTRCSCRQPRSSPGTSSGSRPETS